MKKFFNLTDLIITIVILGILAVIILLNINHLNEKAKVTSLNADKRNIQLAVDKYNLDKGYCPSIIQPTLGNPQAINFKELYTDYMKNKPQHKDAFYWVDVDCLVYVSLIDAPTDVSVDVPNGKVTWTPHKDSSNSIIYVKRPNGSIKLVDEDRSGDYDGEDGKDHLVAEEDKYGLDTPPVGEDYTGYPKPSEEDDTPKGPIVACDTNGFICIYTAEELASISNKEGFPNEGKYRLANDIDLKDFGNWEPINDNINGKSFAGVFDGNGFSINNLTILDDQKEYAALFHSTYYASIMNLTFNNVNIEGSRYSAALIGSAYNTNLENISVNGKIKGENNVGGIVGYTYNGFLYDMAFNGEVKGDTDNVGGISGYASNIKGTNFTASGTVEGGNYTGGIFGYTYDVEVANLFSQSNVLSRAFYSGGIAGYASDATYANVYSKGNVSSTGYAGGILGYANVVKIYDSSVEGNINGIKPVSEPEWWASYQSYGGLTGYAYDLEIIKSTFKGDIRVEVEDSQNIGGISGYLSSGKISDVSIQSNITSGKIKGYIGGAIGYAYSVNLKYVSYIGDITSEGEYAGGLVGYMSNSTVSDSYVEGGLTNSILHTGGIAGYDYGGIYNRVYSNMTVDGVVDEKVNAVFGYIEISSSIENPIKDLYWNSEISKQIYSSQYEDSSGDNFFADINNSITGKHLSADGIKSIENYSNWDLTSIWEFKNDFPKLRPEIEKVDISEFISKITPLSCNNLFEGKGTETSPYKLKTQEDFNNMKYCVTSHFVLENDLIIEGADHVPLLGFKWEDFSGNIDGNNKTITVNNFEESLFDRINNATIKNIKFKDITIGGNSDSNHIISDNTSYLTLDNVEFENIVVDSSGSIGVISSSCSKCNVSNITLKNSSIKTSSSQMNGTIPSTGGALFMFVSNGTYKNINLINVSVEGGYMTGGVIGALNYASWSADYTLLENISLTNVKVKGRDLYTGGIAGYGKDYEIKNATGDIQVTGTFYVDNVVASSVNGKTSGVNITN